MVITTRLGYPMLDVALVADGIDINQYVRIDKLEFRYSPLHDSRLAHIKRRRAVMCGQRVRDHNKTKSGNQERQQFIFQETRHFARIIPPLSAICQRFEPLPPSPKSKSDEAIAVLAWPNVGSLRECRFSAAGKGRTQPRASLGYGLNLPCSLFGTGRPLWSLLRRRGCRDLRYPCSRRWRP